jgi:hypothetical protein
MRAAPLSASPASRRGASPASRRGASSAARPQQRAGVLATAPAVPTGLKFSPNDGGAAESLAPTFSAGYSDSDGTSGYVQFEVLNSAGTVVESGNGSTVSSGGTSSWTASTQLQVGGSYKVQARAYSGGLYSAYAPAVSFYVDPRLAWG